jgi:hypothetical protein
LEDFKVKRTISFALAALLILAFALPAFAASETYLPSLFWMDGKIANEWDDPGVNPDDPAVGGPLMFAFVATTGVNFGEFDFDKGTPTSLKLGHGRADSDAIHVAKLTLAYGPDKGSLTNLATFDVGPTGGNWNDIVFGTYNLSATWPTGRQQLWLLNTTAHDDDTWKTGVNVTSIEIAYGDGGNGGGGGGGGSNNAGKTSDSTMIALALTLLGLSAGGFFFIRRKIKA